MFRLYVSLIVFALWLPCALGQKDPLSVTSPDQKHNLIAKDKVLSVLDAKTQKTIISIRAHTADITGLGFSPDGKMLASVDKDGSLKLFDAATGRELISIKAGLSGGLVFSKDGKTVEVKNGDDTKKFDLATGKEVK